MSACFHTASVTCENCRHLRDPIHTLPLVSGRGITLPPGEPLHAVELKQVLKQRDEARAEVERVKLACNTQWHDLERIASLCERTADEYPLKAVERTVRELAEARNLLANIFDRYACAACSHGKTGPDCPCGFHAAGAYLDRTEKP